MSKRQYSIDFALLGTPAISAAIATVWFALFLYDTSFTSYWRLSPKQFGLLRILLPLVAFIPMIVRLRSLKEEGDGGDQKIYTIFTRLTVAATITVVGIVVLRFLPYEYSNGAVPISFFSLLVGRAIALIVMVALPLLIENLLLIYRGRSRRGTALIPKWYIYPPFIAAIVAQFLPLSIGADGVSLSMAANIMGGVLGLTSLILSIRSGWIINLRKRQKYMLVLLSLLGIVVSSFLLSQIRETEVGEVLMSIAPGLNLLAWSTALALLMTYMEIFIVALLALPTADAMDRRNTEVSSLANFARLLARSVDTNDLIDTAIAMTGDATSARAVWLELHGGGSVEVLYGKNNHLPERIARQLMDLAVEGKLSLRDCVTQRRSVETIDRISGVGWGAGEKGGTLNEIRSIAAAPLQLGEEYRGTLYLAKERSNGFDREDLIVLAALADQIAIAIEHSRLIQSSIKRERFEQEMLIARDLQQRLLPKVMPQSPFYDLYAESRPASLVGGDYFDVVSFSDQTIGILIADVSGKGASAALYMGMVKGVIQALSGQCASPKELLAQANVALHGNLDQRWFVTMTCAQIIDEKRTLLIARAGHCPTLMVRSGNAAYTRPRGIGLAIAKPKLFDGNLEIEEITFESGDYVIFYSDGLPEARATDGSEFGYEALLTCAHEAAIAEVSPRVMRDAIFDTIEAFVQEEPQADDSTLMILRWQ